MSQPARYPGYLPYPNGAIPRWEGEYSVPNEASVNWPQAQFAPKYLKPGSPSVSPDRYEAGGPLSSFKPSMYSAEVSALGPSRTAVPVRPTPALLPQDQSWPPLSFPELGDDSALANPEVSSTLQALQLVAMISAPIAMAVSYSRNKSIGWAFLSGLPGVSMPYLIYVGIEKWNETRDENSARAVPNRNRRYKGKGKRS